MPSRPSSEQCAFHDGRRCRRKGRGSPPICDEHRAAISDMGPKTALGGVIEALLTGQLPTQDSIRGAMADFASRITGRKVNVEEIRQAQERATPYAAPYVDGFAERVRARTKQWVPPRDPQAEAKAKAISAARRALGFSAKEPLTEELIRARRQQLARKHHPDRGGSVERMAQINDAVDILLQPL